MGELDGKVAIVTGAGRLRGIGRGAAVAFAKLGADVVVTGTGRDPSAFPPDEKAVGWRDIESSAEQVRALGTRALPLVTDVASIDGVQAMVDRTLEEFGRIDILVNDAGIIGASQWWEREVPSEDDWSQVFAVNVRGVVMVSEAVSRHMRERRYGKIINIASIAARQGSAEFPHYSTSKAAVMSWTQSHALQMAPYSVNVNAICPGLLWTPMFEAIVRMRARRGAGDAAVEGLSGRELFERSVEKTVPMGREQTPDDIGRLAAFLASDDAWNITGQAINVDGGLRMN